MSASWMIRPMSRERGIVEVVVGEEALEAAAVVVVAELDAAHIERRCVCRYLVGVVDEHELRVRIDEPRHQPGAGGAIDVAVAPRRPPHRRDLARSERRAARRLHAPRRARAAGSSPAIRPGAARGEAAPASAAAAPRRPRSRPRQRRRWPDTPRRPALPSRRRAPAPGRRSRSRTPRWWPRRRRRRPRLPATRAARGCGCPAAAPPHRPPPGRRRAGAACATG